MTNTSCALFSTTTAPTHGSRRGFVAPAVNAATAGTTAMAAKAAAAAIAALLAPLLFAATVNAAAVSAASAPLNAAPLPPNHGKVATEFYIGASATNASAALSKRPLLVALGGAEGGNAWAGARAANMRNLFLADGYAMLAVGYFGMPGTPARLDRISLEGVFAAVEKAAARDDVDARCIAVMGGSKGAELALLLASRYPEFKAVAAVVAPDVSFVGHTDSFDTASFTWRGADVPYVPMTEKAVPALMKGDKRQVFDLMSEDQAAVAAARIAVEKINGPVFLLSASKDELWASREMSDRIVARLQSGKSPFVVEHVVIEGDHAAPMRHLNLVRAFLNKHFLPDAANGCKRPPQGRD